MQTPTAVAEAPTDKRMRVRQVLSYVSSRGEYGGPSAVARSQCEALAGSGAEVSLFSGWDGEAIPPTETPSSYSGRLFRSVRLGRTFAGVFTPKLLIAMARSRKEVDIHHVHLARDLTTLPAAIILLLLRRPYIVQPHGMIRRSPRLPHRILDRLAVRPVLRGAMGSLALNRAEADDLRFLGATRRLRLLPNGIAVNDETTSGEDSVEVIFVGRLHERKRLSAFLQTALLCRDSGDPIDRFIVVGPDEGELQSCLKFIEDNNLGDYVRYEGAKDNAHARNRMARCRALVMPSRDEPFGLVALEALSMGVPVVVDKSSGILDYISSSPAVAAVNGSDPQAIRDALLELLERVDMRHSAKEAIRTSQLDIKVVAEQLLDLYRHAA